MRKKRGPTAYTEEFRREAVRLLETQPNELAQIARDLGVHPETLRSWWQRVQRDREAPIVRPAQFLSLEEENRRLRQENARLAEERDILKKATAFFARDAR